MRSALWNSSQPFPFRTTFVAAGSDCGNSVSLSHFSPISCIDEAQVLHLYGLVNPKDAQLHLCAGRMQNRYPVHVSGASSLLQDLEEPSTLLKPPPPHKHVEGRRAPGENSVISEYSPREMSGGLLAWRGRGPSRHYSPSCCESRAEYSTAVTRLHCPLNYTHVAWILARSEYVFPQCSLQLAVGLQPLGPTH